MKLSLASAALLAVGALAGTSSGAGPMETLRARDSQIREILNEQNRGAALRNEASLRQAVNASFDYEAHARLSFGRNWETLSERDRKEALRLVSTLLERSALEKVRQYSTQKIQYLSESVHPGGTEATVLTRVRGASDTAEIGYRMLRAGETWKIVDIVVEGASSVESNRAAFAKEIRSIGVNGLLDKLRKKVERASP